MSLSTGSSSIHSVEREALTTASASASGNDRLHHGMFITCKAMVSVGDVRHFLLSRPLSPGFVSDIYDNMKQSGCHHDSVHNPRRYYVNCGLHTYY